MRSLRTCAEKTAEGPYTLKLVTPATFPPSEYTKSGGKGTGPYYHMTVVPDKVTSSSLVDRMAGLWPLINTVELRLSKFLSDVARDSMCIIKGLLPELKRPDYWTECCDWIVAIQKRFPSKSLDDMSTTEREEMRVWALATGKASNRVHYTFCTAANFIDFMTMDTREAIVNDMDKRSDPRTNQVSSLARARAAKGVECVYGIGLVWDGVLHPDDLDLSVHIEDGKIDYSNLKVLKDGNIMGTLDFDAGVEGTEAEPVENVTLAPATAGQLVSVYINNFTRRTVGDVHCSVIITQLGNSDIIIPVVWPKNRGKGDFLHVVDHVFTAIDPSVNEVKMSDREARAMRAQAKEFGEMFGLPKATVATVEDVADLTGVQILCRMSGTRVSCDESKTAADPLAELEALTRAASGRRDNRKKYLSDRVTAPRTVSELVARVADFNSISVHLADHVPGYATVVKVATDRALRNGVESVAMCNYSDKFRHPLHPTAVSDSAVCTARLDASWMADGRSSDASVNAIARIDGMYFFVLNGACLSSDEDAFPRGAGFYTASLTDDAHKHRSKWAFLNTSVSLSVPTDGVPAIGTFVTRSTIIVYLDGVRTVLSSK